MDEELSKLENRVEQLVGLYESCKVEGRELRARLTRLEADNRALAEKLAFATNRLEHILEQLPES